MSGFYTDSIDKSPRIQRLVDHLFEKTPEIEADRAVLLTESYRQTEGEPTITRRAKAFKHILENIPITIRPDELIVGSTTKSSRSCQVFPEFSCDWLEKEFDTIATRSADPFYISEETKKALAQVYKYWRGKTTSELAAEYMTPEARLAIEHNIFTPGNYFINGVGHVTVNYAKVLKIGYEGIIEEAKEVLSGLRPGDSEFAQKSHFLNAVIMSCRAVCDYAKRYAALARQRLTGKPILRGRRNFCRLPKTVTGYPQRVRPRFMRHASLLVCQMLIQTESSGHSISPPF